MTWEKGDSRWDIVWEEQLLGIVSDSQIARELGVSRQTVRTHRRALNIPPSTAPAPPVELETLEGCLLRLLGLRVPIPWRELYPRVLDEFGRVGIVSLRNTLRALRKQKRIALQKIEDSKFAADQGYVRLKEK